jgi:hypothetical protein
MTASRLSVLIIALTLVTAMIGGWVGVNYGLRRTHPRPQLDQLVHTQLHLTPVQNDKLAQLEAEFALKQTQFEADMRAANRDIASAITVRHAYDADTQAAIDRLQSAMIGLQQATVQHVIAMRALLSDEQVEQFDRTINQALVVPPQ